MKRRTRRKTKNNQAAPTLAAFKRHKRKPGRPKDPTKQFIEALSSIISMILVGMMTPPKRSRRVSK